MAFYRMPSGHFAYVINESGNRQLVTEEQFQECCCPAPSACPCAGTWPPAEWPCNELLESYSTSGNIDKVVAPVTYNTNFTWSDITVTATSNQCQWDGEGTVTRTLQLPSGDVTSDITAQIRIELTGGQWNLSVLGPGATVGKSVGQTPTGSYSVDVSDSGSGTVS
jgi:hypothetical protein